MPLIPKPQEDEGGGAGKWGWIARPMSPQEKPTDCQSTFGQYCIVQESWSVAHAALWWCACVGTILRPTKKMIADYFDGIPLRQIYIWRRPGSSSRTWGRRDMVACWCEAPCWDAVEQKSFGRLSTSLGLFYLFCKSQPHALVYCESASPPRRCKKFYSIILLIQWNAALVRFRGKKRRENSFPFFPSCCVKREIIPLCAGLN